MATPHRAGGGMTLLFASILILGCCCRDTEGFIVDVVVRPSTLCLNVPQLVSYDVTASLAGLNLSACALRVEASDGIIAADASVVRIDDCDADLVNVSGNVSVTALRVGHAHLVFCVGDGNVTRACVGAATLPCITCNEAIQRAFQIIIQAFLVAHTVGFGVKLEFHAVRDLLRSNPAAPLVGLFCQIVIMPLVAFGLAHAFRIDPSQNPSAASARASPSGGISNGWCLLLGGDVLLSASH
ncbi:PREDICTED: uncharacterized protein LOC106805160 [Priapulus caudatus]|uniref:Uncharacterized protein LOC106805160 n=1 Tax=Priapulus caudatus TaxID=37621 RepID=A0ABM1DQC1_PRICU|nr:PREDICTED: uncharacterized protein LOC106805160 [Priapulus caudatus]